ncbi:MAG: 4Fe-4S binding protein [Armatimonadota bacterium]|nr:4Fe-4S binding protein [Armatimonadota bacterium]
MQTGHLTQISVMPHAAESPPAAKDRLHPSSAEESPHGRLESLAAFWRGLWTPLSLLVFIRAVGIVLFTATPLFLFLRPQNGLDPYVAWPGTRVVWTVVVALLPAVILIAGFHNWRQVCPLMMFARMSEWVGWPDKRTTRLRDRRRRFMPAWVADYYPVITWTFLAAMLLLRILIINSDTQALAWTFVGLAALAMAVGFRYTGKAWCNFICPVGTIERIYTDTYALSGTHNSRCPTCTRCKIELTRTLCPDINQESDYWNEIRNSSRAFAYYAFPGLVFGFYLWYFVHQPDYWNMAGGLVMPGHELRGQDGLYDWGYYLSGDWTRVVQPWRHLMDRGFGFSGWPFIPTLLAAPLTLAATSLVSLLCFVGVERVWIKRLWKDDEAPGDLLDRVRHPLFCVAGWVAFNIFYTFAGAPSFRLLPSPWYSLLQVALALLSCYVLYSRLQRHRAGVQGVGRMERPGVQWTRKHLPTLHGLHGSFGGYVRRNGRRV